MTKRILILSANPKDTSALDLETEKREIRNILKSSNFDIETRGAVRAGDLQEYLLEIKPQIVHFCGHGNGTDGIALVNDKGKTYHVSTQALVDLFKIEIFQNTIECVVLNACYSEVQANAISEHINYVVGMSRSILDDAAIIFAKGFYRAIATGDSIQTAYEIGKNAIQLASREDLKIRRKLVPVLLEAEGEIEQTPEYSIPVLKQKPHLNEIKTIEIVTSFVKTSFRSFIGHSDLVRDIAFTPDGQYLVSSSNDRTVRLWDIKNGQILHLFKGHKERVKSVKVSENGKNIISGSADSTVKIWDIRTGNCLKTINTSLNPKTILNAIVINQKLIATGSTSVQGTIKSWDLNTGEMKDAVKAAFSGIRSLAISHDGKTLVSGSGGKTIKVWQLDDEQNIRQFNSISNAHLSSIFSLAIHDNILVSGGEDRTIKIWNLEEFKNKPPKIIEGHAGSIRSLAISPDGTKIASASEDYTVKLWDIQTGEFIESLTGHLGVVRTVAFSPDGKILASAGDDWEIKLWHV
ncbi:MAG: CHAT domain-containing protein [Xenococcus sp. (in: cyanobacteria)]